MLILERLLIYTIVILIVVTAVVCWLFDICLFVAVSLKNKGFQVVTLRGGMHITGRMVGG